MALLSANPARLTIRNCTNYLHQSAPFASANVHRRFQVKLLMTPTEKDRLLANKVEKPSNFNNVSRLKSRNVPTAPTVRKRVKR